VVLAFVPLLSSRRGYPEQQQQPLLVVKVELDEYEDGKVALCLSNLIASLSHSHNLIITNFLIIFHSHNISIQCVQNILRGHPHQVPLRHRRRMWKPILQTHFCMFQLGKTQTQNPFGRHFCIWGSLLSRICKKGSLLYLGVPQKRLKSSSMITVYFIFLKKQSRQVGKRFLFGAWWSRLCRWRLHFEFFFTINIIN